MVEQMDVFLPLSNRKIFLFQLFCLLLFDNFTFMKAIKKIEVNTKNKKSLLLTEKKWLEDFLKLRKDVLSFFVELKHINESKEYVQYYNYERYHESLKNVTPAEVYFGTAERKLRKRKMTKNSTLKARKKQYQNF